MLSGGLFACVLDSVLGLLMSFQSFHVFPVPKSEQLETGGSATR